MSDITVYVFKRSGRRYFEAQWNDPVTGMKKTRSTKKTTRRDADRYAAVLQDELNTGRYQSPLRTTWQEFRERYEEERLPEFGPKTIKKSYVVFRAVEKHIAPKKLASLNAGQLSRFKTKLRESGASDQTIKGYLAHLMAALRWAHAVGMLHVVPKAEPPKRAKSSRVMKGRPVTAEEFERMQDKVPEIVGEKRANAWDHYLRGLWLSGLRLAESLDLWWDRPDRLHVDLSGKYPMLRVHAEFEKGNQDRLLPITPDFAEFLLSTPEDQRTGRVFKLPPQVNSTSEQISADRATRTVSAIGKAAGVKVEEREGKVKFATAHDLRRAFGVRWSQRVMPAVLQQLMRHESIDTTMRFYVGKNAETTAEAVWQSFSSTFPNTAPKPAETEETDTSQTETQ